jgi:hypothetical protein
MSRAKYGQSGTKDKIWNKHPTVKGKDPELYRKDAYGNTLYYDSYGKNSEMGWQIDHIKPISLFNLSKKEQQLEAFYYKNTQPLYTIENQKKGNRI